MGQTESTETTEPDTSKRNPAKRSLALKLASAGLVALALTLSLAPSAKAYEGGRCHPRHCGGERSRCHGPVVYYHDDCRYRRHYRCDDDCSDYSSCYYDYDSCRRQRWSRCEDSRRRCHERRCDDRRGHGRVALR